MNKISPGEYKSRISQVALGKLDKREIDHFIFCDTCLFCVQTSPYLIPKKHRIKYAKIHCDVLIYDDHALIKQRFYCGDCMKEQLDKYILLDTDKKSFQHRTPGAKKSSVWKCKTKNQYDKLP